ncbi:hypothetical protein WICMUC_004284 [Wickerhamomyces mucosus]|uniref:Uncharacterized protein n=1 Tax=Wickerhamomyces mucosus TaxID=1378264 RepID=A0A9P8PH97_9ASCO|nr:hypothetical protein WICMUC_004284 [Wickerhamomyces mucosus]
MKAFKTLISILSLAAVSQSTITPTCGYVSSDSQLSIYSMGFSDQSSNLVLYKYSDINSNKFPMIFFKQDEPEVICEKPKDKDQFRCLVRYKTLSSIELSSDLFKIIQFTGLNDVYNISDRGYYCAKSIDESQPSLAFKFIDSKSTVTTFFVRQMVGPYLFIPLAALFAIYKKSRLGNETLLRMLSLAFLSTILTLYIPLTSGLQPTFQSESPWLIMYTFIEMVLLIHILTPLIDQELEDISFLLAMSYSSKEFVSFMLLQFRIEFPLSSILGVYDFEPYIILIGVFSIPVGISAILALVIEFHNSETTEMSFEGHISLLFVISPGFYTFVWLSLKLWITTRYSYADVLDNFDHLFAFRLLVWWEQCYYGLVLSVWIWIELKFNPEINESNTSKINLFENSWFNFKTKL